MGRRVGRSEAGRGGSQAELGRGARVDHCARCDTVDTRSSHQHTIDAAVVRAVLSATKHEGTTRLCVVEAVRLTG